jgi:hypothetical protein
MNGTGGGVQTVGRGTSRQVFATTLTSKDVFRTPVRLDAVTGNLVDPQPAAAFGDRGIGYVAWLQATGPTDPPAVHGRQVAPNGRWRAESRLTNLALGAVDPNGGVRVASDRLDDAVVVAVQAAADGTRRLVAAMVDGPPRRFFTFTRNVIAGHISVDWGPALDLWGPVRYQVQIDGKTVGRTARTRFTLHRRLCAARHSWRVVATDRRGQHTATATRVLVVHGGKPCPPKKKH